MVSWDVGNMPTYQDFENTFVEMTIVPLRGQSDRHLMGALLTDDRPMTIDPPLRGQSDRQLGGWEHPNIPRF
jgi:hypothetical protein